MSLRENSAQERYVRMFHGMFCFCFATICEISFQHGLTTKYLAVITEAIQSANGIYHRCENPFAEIRQMET